MQKLNMKSIHDNKAKHSLDIIFAWSNDIFRKKLQAAPSPLHIYLNEINIIEISVIQIDLYFQFDENHSIILIRILIF